MIRFGAIAAGCVAMLGAGAAAKAAIGESALDAAARAEMPRVVEWRRDFHQHPELGNRELRTSQKVAEQLRSLGIEVRTGIAHTGVVGILRGGKPGPTIGLRTEMDALPVTEPGDLPFKSTATSEYRGQKVGVMHACGHDGHMAILLGVADVLARTRKDLPGTVLFIFQPAEEGAPDGERGGAPLMLAEGLFDAIRPDAVVGLHLMSTQSTGKVGYRVGPMMAAADQFRIVVTGRQTHGGMPWGGIDPIVIASQIVLGLQTIVSRQVDITRYPAVVSVGAIRGGIRNNIIPDDVELVGTLRTYDPAVRADVMARLTRTAQDIAAASGGAATIEFGSDPNPVLVNDPQLAARVLPALQRAVGRDNVVEIPYVTAAEDFAYYGQRVPAFFFIVGSTAPGVDPATAPRNHSPLFQIDEASLQVGLRAMLGVAVDFLQGGKR